MSTAATTTTPPTPATRASTSSPATRSCAAPPPCHSSGAGPGATAAVVACYVTAAHTAETRVFKQFMTPTPPSASSSSHGHGHHSSRPPSAKAANLVADVTDGKAQAAQLARSGFPVYYPALMAAGSNYCTNATCPIRPIAD